MEEGADGSVLGQHQDLHQSLCSPVAWVLGGGAVGGALGENRDVQGKCIHDACQRTLRQTLFRGILQSLWGPLPWGRVRVGSTLHARKSGDVEPRNGGLEMSGWKITKRKHQK